MPEGPEIRRAADALTEALVGYVAEQVWFGQLPLVPQAAQLSGVTVVAVESRGKAMLIRFENGMNIYSHNQLYGRWIITAAGQRPDTKRQLRLALHNRHHSALLYSASDIAVLENAQLITHPFLRKLGPDPLATDLSADHIVDRLLQAPFHRRRLGGLLTDQSFIAGIGNYLRCEILFVAGLSPNTTAKMCSPDERQRLAETMLKLTQQSYVRQGITNDLNRAEAMMQSGATFEEARFHLFRREGRPCYRCGTPILKVKMNGQPTYLCSVCQRER